MAPDLDWGRRILDGNSVTRRTFLTATGAAGVAGLAGCSGSEGGATSPTPSDSSDSGGSSTGSGSDPTSSSTATSQGTMSASQIRDWSNALRTNGIFSPRGARIPQNSDLLDVVKYSNEQPVIMVSAFITNQNSDNPIMQGYNSDPPIGLRQLKGSALGGKIDNEAIIDFSSQFPSNHDENTVWLSGRDDFVQRYAWDPFNKADELEIGSADPYAATHEILSQLAEENSDLSNRETRTVNDREFLIYDDQGNTTVLPKDTNISLHFDDLSSREGFEMNKEKAIEIFLNTYSNPSNSMLQGDSNEIIIGALMENARTEEIKQSNHDYWDGSEVITTRGLYITDKIGEIYDKDQAYHQLEGLPDGEVQAVDKETERYSAAYIKNGSVVATANIEN